MTMRRALKHNGLSLFFGLILLLTLFGQALAGRAEYNASVAVDGLPQLTLTQFVTSSQFAVDVAENWQSEYLQFSVFIILTVWLVQRGSSESKPPGNEGRESDEEQHVGKHARPDSPAWVRAGGWRTRVYSHSLLTVMTGIFVVSWVAQAITGRVADNEERMRELLEPRSIGGYLASPDFWNRTFQNWQSEMLAIASMAIFAVYLRERG
jgi:hypothetical protein